MAGKMMDFSVTVEGVDELRNSIERNLPANLKRSVYKKMVRAGGNVVAKQARAEAKRQKVSGILSESIIVKVAETRDGLNTFAKVGLKSWKRTAKRTRKIARKDGTVSTFKEQYWENPAKIGHLVEFGTAHSKAKPFLRPAVAATKNAAVAAMARVGREEFGKAVVASAKKGGKK